MDVLITCGSNFSLRFNIEKPFYELWLYTHLADVQKAISQSLDEYYLDKFASECILHLLKS